MLRLQQSFIPELEAKIRILTPLPIRENALLCQFCFDTVNVIGWTVVHIIPLEHFRMLNRMIEVFWVFAVGCNNAVQGAAVYAQRNAFE